MTRSRVFTITLILFAVASVAAAAAAPGSGDKAEEPWKVDEPHGPTKTVSFETDEGTWLHLDLSPDGRRLVFSLLGDLYLLPVEGGTATRITSGPAMDVQPRFSPDGSRIAFASDRGGLENLWLCDLQGRGARQVSTEKSSTVSAPAWSPDGSWLVGRKRLTDRSSLGTVELWLWHLKGGEGVQLTKKDDQPDAADPAFSPDGRFLYFAARDARYQYDRNVNQGIWQIKRFDRTTGQTVQLTGEFGGAATPTPSPDGRSLAFIRRVRGKTRIEVMDLATGRTRLVADDVQRDNQEGFAFHGVFPGFDWTPDSLSVIATAGGKLWRWAVASGDRSEVPFTAYVEQVVTDAVRPARRVGTDDVRARIIRWPVESPDGKRLVFSALGHLYVMELPAGTPHRLTRGDDFEYSPSFSRDGATLAFVTWDDEAGGHVWTMAADGGDVPVRLTDRPGQYVNPSFSPDGSEVVFLAGSGATFRGEDPGDELWHEIRIVPARGGADRYVIGTKNRGQNRRMARPVFDGSGERIFYVEDEPGKPFETPKTVLVSVKTDGTDRRALLRWARAEEAVVSPDGRWVAFSELHNAYVTAIPLDASKTTDVGLENAPLPLARLTDEGGEWMGWADGGRTVTWIYGPVYHRIGVDKAVPEPEPAKDTGTSSSEGKKKGAKKTKDEDDEKKEDAKKLPESETIEIVLTVPRAKPTETVAYRGARLVTMKGDEVVEGGTIVVRGDRIEAVGPDGTVIVPAGARVVDLSGKTVIPGLIDEHAHLHYSTLDLFPQHPWKYLANLAYGVTTTHDPSASTHEVFSQAEMVEAGLMPGPRIFSTGFILYGADDPGRAIVGSLEEARRHVRRMKSLGAVSIKSYMQPKREQRQWLVKAAREEGLLDVPEGGGDLEMDLGMILDGHTTVEHALPITPLYKDVATLFARSGTAYTPTLLVAYGGLSGDKWFHQHYDLWKDPRLQRYVPQGVVDSIGRIRSLMATDPADWHHLDVAAGAKAILDAGGRVCLGGHGQMQGLGPHWEIWAFVHGGMTPIEALRVATRLPAETLGMDRDLGSIEPGKLADFVVLDRNPLEKIENTDSVALVVKNGRAYAPEELERRAPR